jgi:hypothetical protein
MTDAHTGAARKLADRRLIEEIEKANVLFIGPPGSARRHSR